MEKTQRLSADQRDDLVAYLDGELAEGKSHEIDQVLARSEVARHEVEALARTWEMLDLLPVPKAPPEFIERTMTVLKVAEDPVDISQQPWFAFVKRALVVAIWFVAVSGSAWVGFQVTNDWIPNPHRQLLKELPLLEKLDQYQDADSMEFLESLRNGHVFEDIPEKG